MAISTPKSSSQLEKRPLNLLKEKEVHMFSKRNSTKRIVDLKLIKPQLKKGFKPVVFISMKIVIKIRKILTFC